MAVPEKVEDAMNKQIVAELYSAYLYMSMSANFERQGFKGMANWMRMQAYEEFTHADKFYNHIIERGGRVELGQIDKPPSEWATPLDAFEAALKHEQLVTSLIHAIVDVAETEKDHASRSLLQWFVDEQVEEEANAEDNVNKTKMMKDALFMLDKEMAARQFVPPAAEGGEQDG